MAIADRGSETFGNFFGGDAKESAKTQKVFVNL